MFIKLIRQVTRHYPLNSPRSRLLDWLPNVPVDYGDFSAKGGLTISAYRGGEDYVCKQLFWFGDFDPWVNRTLQRLVKPGSIAIDIGANIGTTAMWLALAVGPNGRVICFEPMPETGVRLRTNISTNGMPQIEVWSLALSDRAGKANMREPSGRPGQAKIETCGGVETIEVPLQTFDVWLDENSLERVAVCKIDVEGHEQKVFVGMAETLVKHHIEAFVFERHVEFDTTSDPVFDYLAGYGYRVLRIDKGLRTVIYTEPGTQPRGYPTHDFVAVAPGTDAEQRILPWVVSNN